MFTWLCVSPMHFFFHFENLQYNYHAQTRVWYLGSGPPQFQPLPPQKKKKSLDSVILDTPPPPSPTLESFLDPGIITPLLFSVANNTRKLNKICSDNLYPFSPESIVEHILASTNESRLGDKVSIFSQHFQDCIY